MKVIFCDFDEEWHSKVLDKMSDRLNATEVINISRYNHKLINKDIRLTWINNEDLNYHRYNNIQITELPVLDSTLIERMLSYEALYMPMLDRSELVLSKKMDYHTRKAYYYTELKIMLYLLNKADYCIFSSLPHVSFDYVLYGLCRILNIKYVVQHFCPPVIGKMAASYFFQDLFDHIPQLNNIQLSNQINKLSPRIQAYYDYYGKKKEDIKQLISGKDYADYKKPGIKDYYSSIIERYKKGLLLSTIKRKHVQKKQQKTINAFFHENCSEPKNEKYIYFPLHYQPEIAILPMGGYCFDQVLIIEQLSKAIPDDMRIYVKPHPARSMLDDEIYYKKILSCPKAVLISPKTNSYDLIDNAVAVTSFTGTSILESLIRNKPVIMFGYYIWQYAPNVYHCKKYEDVVEAIESILDKHYSFDSNGFKSFLGELDKYLYDGSLVTSIQKTCGLSQEESMQNIVEGYLDYLQRLEKNG